MGFKTFTSTVLTAADVNDYLMEQAVIACTAATRPTAAEGMVIWETDTNRLQAYDGTGWVILAEPAQSWTPSITNLTAGNGTWTAYTHRSDGYVDYYGKFVLGSTSSVGGTMTMTLPYTAANANNADHSCQFTDTGTAEHIGVCRNAGTTVVDLQCVDASVTYARATPVGGTVPMTWTTTDELTVSGRYRLANRYT